MRIGIEAQRIFRKKKHGMDIVVLELIKALQQIDTVNEYFIFVKKGDHADCLPLADNFQIVEVPGLTYADWEQVFLPLAAKKCKLDILHCTSNTAPLLYGGISMVTLHDVIFLEKNVRRGTSSWYQNMGRIYRQLIVPKVIRKASHVITVSDFERNRIAQVLQISQNNISVIYNSIAGHFLQSHSDREINEVKDKYNLPHAYIFYIGNTDPKKNIFNTLRAYRHYCIHASAPLSLVMADTEESFLNSILEQADMKSFRKNIVLTGYIFNSDLPAIYAGADLFLYPSLRESFGIPLLEAMASGTPVITSNTSALPEIAGTAAAFVDPENIQEIGMMILNLLSNDTFSQNLIVSGYKRIKDFSWNQSAIQLLHTYSSI